MYIIYSLLLCCREHVEELNTTLKERDQQIVSYEKSLKDLDAESRSKKELEIHIRKIEAELDEKQSTEIRLKHELSAANEKKVRDQVNSRPKQLLYICADY